MHPVPILRSVETLGARTAAWLCDIWGVVHNGAAAHRAAVDALVRFRASGGSVILLTNAPRPAADVVVQLDRFDVPHAAYDRIITSGDLTRQWVAEAGTPLFHLGPAKDKGVFAGLNLTYAPVEEAKLVVCTGLFDDETETPEHYRVMLTSLAERRVPMVCANPDVTVERGSRLLYCAGGIAQLYETLGGPVRFAGKPHPEVYDAALMALAEIRGAPVDRARILAIGDSLRTDIAGAHAAGVAALFIASRIHVPGTLDEATLERLFGAAPAKPVAAMDGLQW
jgi:HAD superfamily hydrolase (TIGR01459 family)